MKRNAVYHRLTESNLFAAAQARTESYPHMFKQRCLTAAIFVCACTVVPSLARGLSDPTAPGISTSAAALPDAPLPQTQTQAPPGASTAAKTEATPTPSDQGKQQTKRILFVVPNFRSVSADQKLPPQTAKEKFKTAALESFDYSAIIFDAGQAGVAQAQNSYPEFRQGAAGYGRYFWHTFADETDENLWVQGILPVVLHQDSRYYTLGHGGFIKRGFYAVSRTVITRTDSGRETFNASEVLGSGIAAGISSTYYPTQYRTWTKIGQRWLTNALLDFGTFAAKESWPDVNHAIFNETD